MSMDHKCACLNCDPSLAGPAERQGPAHHHVQRFDDSVALRGSGAVCTLDGEDVSRGVFEFLVGDEGWVLEYCRDENGRVHFCCKPDFVGSGRHAMSDEERDALNDIGLACRRRRFGKVELHMRELASA